MVLTGGEVAEHASAESCWVIVHVSLVCVCVFVFACCDTGVVLAVLTLPGLLIPTGKSLRCYRILAR